jgi:membrane-bound metal-dependent hydrolase YbcI (DUF457 family)
MILGHWACASLVGNLWIRERAAAVLVAAAYGPDLIDKTLNVPFGTPGRGYGHSLVVFVVAAVVGYAVARRIRAPLAWYCAAVTLWASHLVGDFVVPKVLFWPLLGPLDPGERFSFLRSAYRLYVEWENPEMLAAEILCVTAAIVVILAVRRAAPARGSLCLVGSRRVCREFGSGRAELVTSPVTSESPSKKDKL